MSDKKEFVRVIQANKGLVYKVSRLYTNSKNDQEDLYQEIVYQLWKSFAGFNQQAKISTWMYRVALNTAVHHLKRSKRRPHTIPLEQDIHEIHEQADQDWEKMIQLLHATIQQLDLLEKGLILLYLEDKSYAEIAAITGLSVTNVGTKISRIKEKLKHKFTKNL